MVEWYGWMEFPEYFAHDKAEILQHYRIPTLSIALADDMIAEGNSMVSMHIFFCFFRLDSIDGSVLLSMPSLL